MDEEYFGRYFNKNPGGTHDGRELINTWYQGMEECSIRKKHTKLNRDII